LSVVKNEFSQMIAQFIFVMLAVELARQKSAFPGRAIKFESITKKPFGKRFGLPPDCHITTNGDK